MKKSIALLLTMGLTFLAGCGGGGGAESTTGDTGSSGEKKIIVGASPAPHAEILEVVKEMMAEEGITLEIMEFNDYVMPNTAVEDGSIDANYFQHITYMNDFNEQNGTHLASVADVHYEPFGIYPGKVASLEELQDGDQIAVPNDGTNEARALMLLEANGLITLKEGAGLSATKDDIAENPRNFDIVELEANQLTARRADVAMAVINGNYALGAGLTSAEALAFEDANSSVTPYINVLTVKEGNEENELILALVDALTSDEVKEFMNTTYGEAVMPVF